MKTWKKIVMMLFATLVVACHNSNDNDEPAIETHPLLPKKELRGVWMATVWGLDWPRGDYNAESQKAKYIEYMDLFARNNINAVFVQVRGMADAFYDSQYEPWSKYITGVAGQQPSYDVLRFMIDEAHKRGISFHAWLNPYRVATRASASAAFPDLDNKIPAVLTRDYNKIRVYNPALPEVRTRIIDIVKDLITKYDVDGIHLDDYFYPALESGENLNDSAEYKKYCEKDEEGNYKLSIADFRRHNVDLAVKGIHDAIQSVRPEVVFSISPAANNDNNYNRLYADVLKWSRESWTEAIIPQLYFASGMSTTSFNQRLHWWSQYTYNNALMVGYGLYKFGDSSQGEAYQTSEDLAKQFAFSATMRKVQGSVLYSALSMLENKTDIMSVIAQVYKEPALLPYLGKQPAVQPVAPAGLRLNGNELQWTTSDNVYYAVYLSNGGGKTATLIAITRETKLELPQKGTYFVTAVNKKDNAESNPSETIEFQ
ncbi:MULTISPECIES: glycoside hydrolase family 10 protein [Prevotellaceae]|uniref:glycoside hydrolase family 10 protein n=1 Tax=Prevotellaceae TaxID=171552 RepID=UPI0003D379D0|nr:family 10 glycosylhydrolase [Prevotella phocaeensis]ETD17593.1 hypothetical protein HMPREF1199_01844 [Hoylesella oralis CC98A]